MSPIGSINTLLQLNFPASVNSTKDGCSELRHVCSKRDICFSIQSNYLVKNLIRKFWPRFLNCDEISSSYFFSIVQVMTRQRACWPIRCRSGQFIKNVVYMLKKHIVFPKPHQEIWIVTEILRCLQPTYDRGTVDCELHILCSRSLATTSRGKF